MDPIKSAPIGGKHRMADLLIEDDDLYKWSEGEMFFINLVRKNTYYNDEAKPVIRFHKIAKVMDTSINVCSNYWSAIKDRYNKYKNENKPESQFVKYLDGTLSFTDNTTSFSIDLSDDDPVNPKLNSEAVEQIRNDQNSSIVVQNDPSSSTLITEDTIAAVLRNRHDEEPVPSNQVVDLISQVISISLQKQIQASIISDNNILPRESVFTLKPPHKVSVENHYLETKSKTDVKKSVKKQQKVATATNSVKRQRKKQASQTITKKPKKQIPEKISFLQNQSQASATLESNCPLMTLFNSVSEQSEQLISSTSICSQNTIVPDNSLLSPASHLQSQEPAKDVMKSKDSTSEQDLLHTVIVSDDESCDENSPSNKSNSISDYLDLNEKITIVCDTKSTSPVPQSDYEKFDDIRDRELDVYSSKKRERSPKQLDISNNVLSDNNESVKEGSYKLTSDISQNVPANKKQKIAIKDTIFRSSIRKGNMKRRLLNLVKTIDNKSKRNSNITATKYNRINQLIGRFSTENQTLLPSTTSSEKKQMVNDDCNLNNIDDISEKCVQVECKDDAFNFEHIKNTDKSTTDSIKVENCKNITITHSEEDEIVSFFSPEHSEKGDDENLEELIFFDDEKPVLNSVLYNNQKDVSTENKIIKNDTVTEPEDEDKLTPLNNKNTVREFFTEVGEFVSRRFTTEQQEEIRKNVWAVIAEMDSKICNSKKND